MSSAPPKLLPSRPKHSQKDNKDQERDKRELKASQLLQSGSGVERLKTVVRRLPPNLPEDVFWQSVQPWVSDETATWKVFYPGKLRKRLNKENIPSRAYIAFKEEEQLALFSKEYDGHLFRDKAGNESQAVVEFAPYQKVPPEKKKPDARNATIEKDEDYISFLESLNAAANQEPVSLETLIASSQPPPPPKTTPLLEALKAEKSAHKDKEAILRNHAHYGKDITSAPLSKKDKEKEKDDGKKRGTPKQDPVQAQGVSGKKSAKRAAAAAKQQQAQANGVKTAPGPSNVNAAPVVPNTAKPSHPPRAPRAMRQQQQQQQRSVPGPHAVSNPTPNSTQPSVNLSLNITAASAAESSGATPSPIARRPRPVIGIASRQFEAALNGAVGSVSGEKKSRRERERDKEREKTEGVTADDIAAVVAPAQSPKKDRGGAASRKGEVRVPSILQRTEGGPSIGVLRPVGTGEASEGAAVDGTANTASAIVGAALAEIPAVLSSDAGRGRGGRRGRARGRGAVLGGRGG